MKHNYDIENLMLFSGLRPAAERETDTVSEKEARRAYFKMTEERLEDMRMIRARIKYQRERLKELEAEGLAALAYNGKSIVSAIGRGSRVDRVEAHAREVDGIKRLLSRDEAEIRQLEIALELIRDDRYYPVMELRYVSATPDCSIAEKLNCDTSTVARHRKRLVSKVMAFLYGC